MTMTEADDRRVQAWARLTGAMLVLTNLTAMFAFWVRSEFTVRNDAAATAANMVAGESLVRLGIVGELLTVAGVVPLIVGLYVVLKPFGRDLALLALSWRVVENCILAVLSLAMLTALTLVVGGAFMTGADPAQTQAFAYALLRVHSSGFQVGFLFLGLGQALFSWLWWKSRLVPRWLAGLGIAASSVMAAMAVGIIAWPQLYAIVGMAYMAPMGLYEIGLGLWLVARGVRLPD